MIKNVVFDIGNVLVGFPVKAFLEKKGFPEDLLEPICIATVKSRWWNEIDRGVMSMDEIADRMAEDTPVLEPEIRKMMGDVSGIVTRFDHAIPWIEELKSKGLKTYCLSNFGVETWAQNQPALDFFSHLDGGVKSYEVRCIKPDREIYECLFKKYDLVPEECVFIDDLASNIDAAKALGMKGLVFMGYKNTKKALDELISENK